MFTTRTVQLLEQIRDLPIRTRVAALFQDDCALYASPTPEVLERVRFAVIKLAMEGPLQTALAERLYHTDTRDLLVCAGFGNDPEAHESWCRAVLEGGKG